MAKPTVIEALSRFLPDFLRENPFVDQARRRAIWAITHCRTPAMGGHVHACGKCGAMEFAYHSCNHRACPRCGRKDTARWVERELGKRVGAPYFMVTFTLPGELRPLFLNGPAREIHDLFFAAASGALAHTLANPRWLGACHSGFTMVLHTWNQRLLFHPHIHAIVPGAGIDAGGRVVVVPSPGFLVPQPVLRSEFRRRFRHGLADLRAQDLLMPQIDPAVWRKDWGVDLRPFGDGSHAIKYLGTYVCRTAISDSRIAALSDSHVAFRWKDRAKGGAQRKETLPGVQFISRYLLHVLPRGLRSIRRYGFCHPAAKARRERIAIHTGCLLYLGPPQPPQAKPPRSCPCCGGPMRPVLRLPPEWIPTRAPPHSLAA